MKKKFLAGLALGLFLGVATTSTAAVITLDFEGVGNVNPVGNFYNGGGGTNYGITFSDNTLALVDSDAGGSGNFGGEPSPNTVMFFLTGNDARMTVASGFDTGFSFWYSAISLPGSVGVYNINNVLLASLNLPVTPSDGGDPNGNFSPFYQLGVGFAGTASYVSFAGVQNQIGFDNVTFGSVTPDGGGTNPVPEPATMLLMGTGIAGLIAARRKKKA